MPPKKKKGGKKGKKGPEDWGVLQKAKYVTLDICNTDWQSMRFRTVVNTSVTLSTVRELIMREHSVPSTSDVRLFRGANSAEENLLKQDDFGLSLEQLSISGGPQNDRIVQVITYDYQPFKSILNLPRKTRLSPLQTYV